MRWVTFGCALLLLVVSASGGVANAACRRSEDLAHFARSADATLECAGRRFVREPDACRVPSPPACAAASLAALRDLTHGALSSTGRGAWRRDFDFGSSQASCQRAIFQVAREYVARRWPGRVRGERVTRRGSALARVAGACSAPTVRVGSSRIPAVGGRCAPLYADLASPDPNALARCLVASLEAALDRAAPHPLRPNLVLILTDDQRADTLGFMPLTLERLAQQGLRFDDGFVTTPVCGPSRASLLTGRYASRHGIRGNADLQAGHPDYDEHHGVAAWLRSVGYRTAFLGKYQNGGAGSPRIPAGWDRWDVFPDPRYVDYVLERNGQGVTFGSAPTDYSTDVLARRAVQFIRESRDAPFLVVLSLFAGHEPFTPAPRHAGRLAGLAPARPPSFLEPDVGGKPGWVRFLKGIGASPDRIDATRVAQLETLLAADEAVARVVDALDGFGLTDHTAVFFTSDNGIHWGEHWWTSKFSGYEESLRVPLLVRYPLLVPLPAASPALALNIDLAPTFADLARVQPMTTVDGESLRRVLEGEPSQRQDFLFESFDDFVVTSMRGVRDARYKLLVTRPGTPSAFEELYDLEQDPYELHNRAGDPALAAVLARLRARLAELTGS